MALDAGELTVFLEYGCNLKDKDWLGRQDPYCLLTCGAQKYRSQTHVDGGKNPVWNQQFRFNVINENDVGLVVMEQDVMLRDEVIGTGRISLARVRTTGSDRQQVQLVTKRGRQRGFVQVNLTFVRNAAFAGVPGAQPAAYPYAAYPSAPSAPPAAYGYPSYPGYPNPAPFTYAPQHVPSFHAPPPASVYPPAAAHIPAGAYASAAYPAPVMVYPPPYAMPAAYPAVPSPYHGVGPRSITASDS